MTSTKNDLPAQKTHQKSEGILLLNKEKGITSFGLVHLLRKITHIQKIGHAGTLDPIATGLMILLLGKKYTKQADLFSSLDKEYIARVFLGKNTETFDEEGATTFENDRVPSLEEIAEALEKFQGDILQTPPMYSAKKVRGKKLYELARKGLEIERTPALIHVHIILLSYKYPYLDLRIACSKGTYVRSIANDLGNALKTGGYLYALKRTRIGPFCLENAISHDSLTEQLIQEHILYENPIDR